MKTEFEIKFYDINTDDIRRQLEYIGASLLTPLTSMRRVVFANPMRPESSYVRVRDEGNVITCTYKNILSGPLDINSVQEIECEVSDFESMKNIFIALGMPQKAFQETRREVWEMPGEGIYFMLDEWPGLKSFIEIEAETAEKVKIYTEKLGFVYENGFFGAVDVLYEKFLGIPPAYINSLSEISFLNPPIVSSGS